MCCWFFVELAVRKVWEFDFLVSAGKETTNMAEEMGVAEIGNVAVQPYESPRGDLHVCICAE